MKNKNKVSDTERALVHRRVFDNEVWEVDVPGGLSAQEFTEEAVRRVQAGEGNATRVTPFNKERAGSVNVYRSRS